MAFKYVNQCNNIRANQDGEIFWQAMIHHKKQISIKQFLLNVDVSSFTAIAWDEGETIEDFIADDCESGCYISKVFNHVVYFIQTSGFEFIFMDADRYNYSKGDSGDCKVILHNNMIRLI